ncbi:unnamed protein product [Prorocentrum cordatum]|uniref:Uncharacterized protein n=1 Tax=Prorocentrum cordatum TaxID=2364126 RepID=A0ABN9W3Y0_9DINO|nr:unnamed protein product [Polarella glacialis]
MRSRRRNFFTPGAFARCRVTLLQTGRDFSASPADGEHSRGDLASALPQPAGTGGREASAPAAGGLAGGPPAAGQNATAPLGGGQPAAGRDGHGAAAAPAAGRRKLLTQMYRRSGAATWTDERLGREAGRVPGIAGPAHGKRWLRLEPAGAHGR